MPGPWAHVSLLDERYLLLRPPLIGSRRGPTERAEVHRRVYFAWRSFCGGTVMPLELLRAAKAFSPQEPVIIQGK